MASTRPTRKSSRRSSPYGRAVPESATPPVDVDRPERKTMLDRWVEPPLRPAAPSFEDYKGLERHGVLAQMAPLGTRPPTKVKLKVKAELPKRLAPIKGGEEVTIEDGRVTPEMPVPSKRKRSDSMKMEDQVLRTSSSRGQVQEQVISVPTTSHPSVKSSPAQPSPNTTPNSRTQSGRSRIKTVVDAAVARASQVGHPHLGVAVKRLYEDSLVDRSLADLLDAVLAQQATPRQNADFRNYIKIARRSAKAEGSASGSTRRSSGVGGGGRSTSNSSAKSPSKTLHLNGPSPARENLRRQLEASKPWSWPSFKSPPKEKAGKKDRERERQAATRAATTNGMTTRKRQILARSRSSSMSSVLSSISSPLSDAPSINGEVDMAEDVDVDGDVDGQTAEIPAKHAPITHSRALLGPKLHTFSTAHPPAATTTDSTTAPSHDSAGLRSAALAATTTNSAKRSSASAGLEQDESARALAIKRQKLTKKFDGVKVRDSHLRVSPSPKVSEPSRSLPSRSAYPQRLRNGTVKKLAGYEGDHSTSPPPPSVSHSLPPDPSVSESDHRLGTPTPSGRAAKKTKKTARVKMSPIKKKSGVIAGIARSGPSQDSPVGYSALPERGEDANEDFCSACGGNGDLLCCDGCDRSFHFTCLDPPMDEDHLPETWFCYVCAANRNPQPKLPRGLFAALLGNLAKKNPVAYNLPVEIREYFEGVKTGDEGEYEEAVTQKSRTRAGWDEVPDLLKLKDSKGKYVLCFRCGKSSLSHQEIIPCDYCNLHWHLDCLDPPMANPPPRGPNGKPRYNWMCPNHVDHELLALDPSVRAYSRMGSCNGGLRTHKVRRPKNARIMDTALRRGFVNNGLIEVENEPSDNEEDFVDTEHYGTVYRLPERGIKLDFIDKIKRSRSQGISATPQPQLNHVSSNKPQSDLAESQAQLKSEFNKRSFLDRKAALNLAQFAHFNGDLGLSADDVENLLATLIAEAPPDVVAMINDPPPKAPTIPPSPPSSESRPDQAESALSEKEKNMLLMIQELIRRRLESAAA